MFQRKIDNKRLREAAQEAKENGYQVLCSLLAKEETSIFEQGLAGFLKFGGNINHLNDYGLTILDACNFLPSAINDYEFRRNLIVNAGGQSGKDISDVARLRAAESIIPGWDNSSIFSSGRTIAASPWRKFSFEAKELQSVSEFIASPVIQHSTVAGGIDVCAMLTTTKPGIGKLFDAGSFISTVFLIKDDWIMTARHSVNYSKSENLSVMFGDEDFDKNTAISISGAIESGKNHKLDYVILKLSRPILGISPLVLSKNNTSTSLLFVGYNEHARLHFSANTNLDSSNFDQLRIVGYQGTGACFSGSPYFDLEGEVCGLHLCASTTKKTGIYIKTIIETNPSSILARLIRKENVSDIPLLPGISFPEFTSSTSMFNFDERGPLKISVSMSTGAAVFSAIGAPNNQSQVGPKKKIAKRLERLRATGKTLTDVQERFLAIGGSYKVPTDQNIQIAHNIAISAIRTAVVSKMNTPILPVHEAAEILAVEAFADAIASSDDEDPAVARRPKIKEKLPNLVRKIREEQKKVGGITPAVANSLIVDAKEVLTLLNGRSKNLMPGHADVNEHLVTNHRDPHLTKTALGYEETAISTRLSQTADAFFGTQHTPKQGNHGTLASSSVNSGNNRKNAYYTP